MSGTWTWPIVESLALPLHESIALDVLHQDEIDELVTGLKAWYPGIATGMESCHLEPAFYRQHAVLSGGDLTRDLLPIVFKRGGCIVIGRSDGSGLRMAVRF
jgi:hypothetical protein